MIAVGPLLGLWVGVVIATVTIGLFAHLCLWWVVEHAGQRTEVIVHDADWFQRGDQR